MTVSTTASRSSSIARLLSLTPLLLVAAGAIGAATYWQWPQPFRDRVIRMLGGIPAAGDAAVAVSGDDPHAGDHDHGHGGEHDHDDEHAHEGHSEENSLELSEQARHPATVVTHPREPRARRPASPWRNPKHARQAFVASVIFDPPKCMQP
jgi:hypothetical protein